MTHSEISAIVSKIAYKNWEFRVLQKGDGFLLQATFTAPDCKTGKDQIQKCRKWYVSSHACEGEVVRTAWKAIEAAEVHEAQEHFKYCGQPIFDPHLHPEDLAVLISMGWIGESVRLPFEPAPAELKAAARRVLEKSKELVTKKGRRPSKPRIGASNGNAGHRKSGRVF